MRGGFGAAILGDGVRKRAMIYLWRAQQSGAIINIMLLGTLTAATLYRQYLKAYFGNYGFPESQELPGVIITMMMIFVAVFGVGFIFDRLKFWKEQSIVGVERNPYASYKLSAKEVYWIKIWLASIASGSPNAEQKRLAELYEAWIRRSVDEDPILKAEVDAVEKWITAGDASAKKLLEGDA